MGSTIFESPTMSFTLIPRQLQCCPTMSFTLIPRQILFCQCCPIHGSMLFDELYLLLIQCVFYRCSTKLHLYDHQSFGSLNNLWDLSLESVLSLCFALTDTLILIILPLHFICFSFEFNLEQTYHHILCNGLEVCCHRWNCFCQRNLYWKVCMLLICHVHMCYCWWHSNSGYAISSGSSHYQRLTWDVWQTYQNNLCNMIWHNRDIRLWHFDNSRFRRA